MLYCHLGGDKCAENQSNLPDIIRHIRSRVSLLFTSLIRHFKYGEGVEQDERTKKIMYRAFAGSWFAILLLIAAMMLADYLGVLKLNVQGALSAIFFGMIITFSAFNWYFGRKGDVE